MFRIYDGYHLLFTVYNQTLTVVWHIWVLLISPAVNHSDSMSLFFIWV